MSGNHIFSAVDTSNFKSDKPLELLKPKIKKKKFHKNKPRQIIRSYKIYIKSPLWIKRKNRYFNRHGKKCEACNKPKYVTLHHMAYRQNYGDEPDSELVALCGRCHNEFHKQFGVSKDMIQNTKYFVAEVKKARSVIWEDYQLEERFKNFQG